MRTRTLLLLAVACGLAILLAGGIRLLTISTDDDASATDLPIGASGSAGDATVTVLAADEADERLVVEVRLGGVDDPSGVGGFELLAGSALPPLDPASAQACAAITVEAVTCDLVFDVAGVVGDLRVLRFHRGEEQVRWSLASRTATTPTG